MSQTLNEDKNLETVYNKIRTIDSLYSSGVLKYQQKQYSSALEDFEKAAKLNDLNSQYMIGLLYDEGHGVKCDPKNAILWYLDAYENQPFESQTPSQDPLLESYASYSRDNQLEASYRIGLLYKNGRGVMKCISKAKDWFKIAFCQDHPGAAYELGICSMDLKYGNFIVSDVNNYFQISAAMGYSDAIAQLGLLFKSGYCRDVDESKHKNMFILAAKKGSILGYHSIADCYWDFGHSNNVEFRSAYRWYRKSADLGNHASMFKLAVLLHEAKIHVAGYRRDVFFQYGNTWDKRMSEKALEWCLKAAQGGHQPALNYIGCLYRDYNVLIDYIGKDPVLYRDRAGTNEEEAVRWFKKGSKLGCPDAMCNLGNMYLYGIGIEKDYQKALELFLKSSTKGNKEATEQANYIYENDYCTPKDPKEAIDFYRNGADLNISCSMRKLGLCFLDRSSTNYNLHRALNYLNRGSNWGDVEATYQLGLLYKGSHGMTQDLPEAYLKFHQAAQLSHREAEYNVGLMCHYGTGTEVDWFEAFHWYKRAADKNHSDALVNLGILYDNGFGVKQDIQEAIRCYKRAEFLDNATGAYNMGLYSLKGRGIKKSYTNARLYFEKGATLGDADSYFQLGMIYKKGQGVDIDYKKALEYYTLAFQKGHTMAMCKIGQLYESGHGVDQSYTDAISWYKTAADTGDTEAQYAYGMFYLNHRKSMEAKVDEAWQWLKKSAEAGHANASYELGKYYYRGLDVVQDYELAMTWFEKAIEKGNNEGYIYIGKMYYYGLGQHVNIEKAYQQFDLAAYYKNEEGAFYLQKMIDTIEAIQDYDQKLRLKRLKTKSVVNFKETEDKFLEDDNENCEYDDLFTLFE